MAQLAGTGVQLNIGFESAYGVPILANGYKIQFAPTLQANTTQPSQESAVIDGNASPNEPFLGFKDGQFSVTVPVESKAFGLFCKGLFDAPTTTADTPTVGINTHVFKIGLTRPTMFCEVIHNDFVGGLVYTTTGIALETMALNLGGDGELLATFTGFAKDTTKSTATAIVSLADYTDGEKFGQFQAAITGTTAKFRTFNINYANNGNPDSYIMDGTASRSSATKGTSSIGGDFTALFEDDTLYAIARANTATQFTATLSNAGAGALLRSIELDMEETKLDATTNTPIDVPNGLEMSFNYNAFFKTGANATALQVTIINDVTSYA